MALAGHLSFSLVCCDSVCRLDAIRPLPAHWQANSKSPGPEAETCVILENNRRPPGCQVVQCWLQEKPLLKPSCCQQCCPLNGAVTQAILAGSQAGQLVYSAAVSTRPPPLLEATTEPFPAYPLAPLASRPATYSSHSLVPTSHHNKYPLAPAGS